MKVSDISPRHEDILYGPETVRTVKCRRLELKWMMCAENELIITTEDGTRNHYVSFAADTIYVYMEQPL